MLVKTDNNLSGLKRRIDLSQPQQNTADGTVSPIIDKFHRSLLALRISVTDRCNHRCPYCMPKESFSKSYSFIPYEEYLSFEEIATLARAFVSLGVVKIRLTGGEPLLRPRISELIRMLKEIDGLEDLALTTNGSLLAKHAAELKSAGLNRLTVSLDSVDPNIFKTMSGGAGDLNDIFTGITEAEKAGFNQIKINAIAQKGLNPDDILNLVRQFKGTNHILRFIEYMDAGNCNGWRKENVLSSEEILKLINQTFPLKRLNPNYPGEVARRYQFIDGNGEIGLISSITQPFCQDCTRMRLSADGKLYNCLFAENGLDIKKALRQNSSKEDFISAIVNLWKDREDRYSQLRNELQALNKVPQKIEMFAIGG
ncbi:MAG: GTP 3',8-cyclase MoaA [Candidatus Omnitrophica bacterium]|nr:GTP 3',8-cyclase MoaA [Candidatus Omnitrophota bacterium]